MAFSRGDLIKQRFVNVIERDIPDHGAVEIATTFTLFRRERSGVQSNVGEQLTHWKRVGFGIKCIFLSVYSDTMDRFQVELTGSLREDRQSLYTAHMDILTGDNLQLDYDGRFYLVEGANYEGVIRRVLINGSKAQMAYGIIFSS